VLGAVKGRARCARRRRFHPLTILRALAARGGVVGTKGSPTSTCLRQVDKGLNLRCRLGVAVLGRSATSTWWFSNWPGLLWTHHLWNQIGVLSQPVAGTLDLNDDSMVQQSVEQRGGDDGIPENLPPHSPKPRFEVNIMAPLP
jgi:hypothetical protein